MKLDMQKTTAKKLYPDVPTWFQDVLKETFGEKLFKKKDFNEIESVEIACIELGIDKSDIFNKKDTPDEVAYKSLKVITKAINGDWEADYDNTSQKKWVPIFNLSSGFGFSYSTCAYDYSYTFVGSRLCFESEEKSDFAGKQFTDLYKQFLK